MLYVAVAAGAFACGLAVIAVVWVPQRARPAVPAAEPVRVREEDLVRPAYDDNGEPTWVAAGEFVWHEIVHWPVPRSTASPRRSTRRRPA